MSGSARPRVPADCPCGTGERFADCCRPLHAGRGSGRVSAPTAERLMRSRYSAFAVGDAAYLLLSWHPSTCPPTVEVESEVDWRGLEIVATQDGTAQDDAGTVEFVARYWDPVTLERGRHHEVSAFVREDGQWFYVGVAPR